MIFKHHVSLRNLFY